MGATDEGSTRELLEMMLDRQRDEIASLLGDVSEAEARARLVPSATTLLGLVKHATFVERVWFHARVAGVERAQLGLPDTVDASFAVSGSDSIASVLSAFDTACRQSRRIAAQHDLDETWEWHGRMVSLRYIHLHLLTELARHAGHGDILVEQLRAQR